jgi:hypothetical protein
MSHSTAVWPPHASLIGAAGPRNRAPLPPVRPLPRNRGCKPASPSPGAPQLPPRVRSLTPLPTLLDPWYPANHRTNILPKRRRLP